MPLMRIRPSVTMRQVARQHLRELSYVASVAAAVSCGISWDGSRTHAAQVQELIQASLWQQLLTCHSGMLHKGGLPLFPAVYVLGGSTVLV
jgi:hypothetical protein